MFDFLMSCPPYQGDETDVEVYHMFMDLACSIADHVMLVPPGGCDEDCSERHTGEPGCDLK